MVHREQYVHITLSTRSNRASGRPRNKETQPSSPSPDPVPSDSRSGAQGRKAAEHTSLTPTGYSTWDGPPVCVRFKIHLKRCEHSNSRLRPKSTREWSVTKKLAQLSYTTHTTTSHDRECPGDGPLEGSGGQPPQRSAASALQNVPTFRSGDLRLAQDHEPKNHDVEMEDEAEEGPIRRLHRKRKYHLRLKWLLLLSPR